MCVIDVLCMFCKHDVSVRFSLKVWDVTLLSLVETEWCVCFYSILNSADAWADFQLLYGMFNVGVIHFVKYGNAYFFIASNSIFPPFPLSLSVKSCILLDGYKNRMEMHISCVEHNLIFIDISKKSFFIGAIHLRTHTHTHTHTHIHTHTHTHTLWYKSLHQSRCVIDLTWFNEGVNMLVALHILVH